MSYGLWTASARTKVLLSALFASTVLVTAAVGGLTLAHVEGQPAFAIVLAVLLAATCSAGCAAIRLPRIGVTITTEEVVIVGPFRTTTVALTHARQFVAEATPGARGQAAISLRRDEADSVRVWVLSRGGLVRDRRRSAAGLQPVADELNKCLSEAKRAVPASTRQPTQVEAVPVRDQPNAPAEIQVGPSRIASA